MTNDDDWAHALRATADRPPTILADANRYAELMNHCLERELTDEETTEAQRLRASDPGVMSSEELRLRLDVMRQAFGVGPLVETKAESSDVVSQPPAAPYLVVGNTATSIESVRDLESVPYALLGAKLTALCDQCGRGFEALALDFGVSKSAFIANCHGKTKPERGNLKTFADGFSGHLNVDPPIGVHELLDQSTSVFDFIDSINTRRKPTKTGPKPD